MQGETAGPHGWLDAGPLGPGVRGLMTTRAGGVSAAPFDTMNLRPPELPGDALDDPEAVRENQRRLARATGARPIYLDQVHGCEVVRLGRDAGLSGRPLPRADASVTAVPGIACTVLVADCLPVLFARGDGRVVAAAHAGWRGLAAGVLERTVAALREPLPGEPAPWDGPVRAWLGACIGAEAFEVGADVLAAFGVGPAEAGGPRRRFRHAPRPDGADRWRADLRGLASDRLGAVGVSVLPTGGSCTVSDRLRFFSFRRDGRTGRMAACVWIAN
jgi:YfiH family protein